MAEKEERISIELLKDDFCDSCDNRGKLKNCCCYEKQEYDERYQKSLPRQEAIKRIEKVLEEGWWSVKTFRQLSEDALNAILGGK